MHINDYFKINGRQMINMTKRGETVKETCNTISPKNLLKVNNGRNSQQ